MMGIPFHLHVHLIRFSINFQTTSFYVLVRPNHPCDDISLAPFEVCEVNVFAY